MISEANQTAVQARPVYHTRDSIEAHTEHRVRRPGRQPLDRTPNRLEHQEIRPHRTPLPHRHDPSRTTLTAAEPVPDDLAEVLAKVDSSISAH
jgi:hypothetical protein